MGFRHLHSYRHFRGSDEERDRQTEGSEVDNYSEFLDFSLACAFTPRLGATLTVPYVEHIRSQVVRDSGGNILDRFETRSAGIGDLRLMGHPWALEPNGDWNIRTGLGLDLPTGQDDARDTFMRFDSATGKVLGVKRTVDQSIQPGDGGWGIVVDALGFYSLGEGWNAYAAGTYTVTPQEKNGVPTFRSNPYEAEMSIADTYQLRFGVEYRVWAAAGMLEGLGGRVEGVTVRDLWGDEEGFRRPGYAVSVEPSLSSSMDRWTMGLQVPIAVYRNRQRSVPDEQQSEATGVHRHGDAAFADYVVMLSVTCRF